MASWFEYVTGLRLWEWGTSLRVLEHESRLGLVKVAACRRQLLPVCQGADDHLVELLPLLLVVPDRGREAVVEIVAIEGQVQLLLAGQLGQDLQLVPFADVEERLETEGIEGVVQHYQFQANKRRCGHFDKLPITVHRFTLKAIDIPIRGVTDVHNAAVALRSQTAVAAAFKDLPDLRWQFVGDGKFAAPQADSLRPSAGSGQAPAAPLGAVAAAPAAPGKAASGRRRR